MLSNITKVERRVRFVVGTWIWALYVTGLITGGLSHILAVIGVIFIATSIMNFCPYYLIFELSTNREHRA